MLWVSVPPASTSPSLLTNPVASTVVVVTAVTVVPLVVLAVLTLAYGAPMYALRSRLSAPLLKLLRPLTLPEDRIVEATVFVTVTMLESVVNWNSGVVMLFDARLPGYS